MTPVVLINIGVFLESVIIRFNLLWRSLWILAAVIFQFVNRINPQRPLRPRVAILKIANRRHSHLHQQDSVVLVLATVIFQFVNRINPQRPLRPRVAILKIANRRHSCLHRQGRVILAQVRLLMRLLNY
ncbi:hypothetical protein HUU62_15805 [Rhodoferax sp. 4810]|nr:hypothetical protein [Rhodoferax jenense]